MLLVILAFDLAVANHLISCKRYYYGEAQQDEEMVLGYLKSVHVFTAVNVQPVLAGWAFGPGIWVGLV